jgi:hypothetical protein
LYHSELNALIPKVIKCGPSTRQPFFTSVAFGAQQSTGNTGLDQSIANGVRTLKRELLRSTRTSFRIYVPLNFNNGLGLCGFQDLGNPIQNVF